MQAGGRELVGPFVSVLLEYLRDPDADIRASAAEALGRLREMPPVVVPALVGLLDDPELLPRSNAVEALGSFGQDAAAAVPALLRYATNAGSATQRQLARETLQRIEGLPGSQAGKQ